MSYVIFPSTFREKYQIKEDEIAIGIIGRLVPIKNHQLFINNAIKTCIIQLFVVSLFFGWIMKIDRCKMEVQKSQ